MTTRSEATLAECPLDRKVSRLRFEARRICDREGIYDLETLDKIHASLAHREYLREIQPFIDMKARMLSLVIPKITIRRGELAEIKYNLSEDQEAAMKQVDEFIANIGEQYGMAANVEGEALPATDKETK